MTERQDAQTNIEALGKDDTVSLKVEPWLNNAMTKFAGSMGLKKSSLIRVAVIDYMRRNDPVLYATLIDQQSD